MFVLSIFLDTDDEQAADAARSNIVNALTPDVVGVSYAVDSDGPIPLDGDDDDEQEVRGCSCGQADYGAPGHDGDPNSTAPAQH